MRNDTRTLLRLAVSRLALALREERRREIIGMVEGCGLDHRDVPLYTEMLRRGDRVYLEKFVRDDATGNVLLNDARNGPEVESISIRPTVIPAWIPTE
ncbi:hypothetical protein ACFW2V_12675 [Streptomyces sp. NPDC058947]|uniref:hypothetical protein n=1 Tax=Streptomyces sp. NPDC058947 TaxID=3346675 RepID=UPI0036CA70B2